MSDGPTVSFRYVRPVNRVADRTIEPAFLRLPSSFRIAHDLTILIVPAPVVRDPLIGEACGFGAFRVVDGKPEIWIAAEKPERSISDEEHAGHLIETFAHELAHYEQWRDGRPLQERGVAVRARTIARLIGPDPTEAPVQKARRPSKAFLKKQKDFTRLRKLREKQAAAAAKGASK